MAAKVVFLMADYGHDPTGTRSLPRFHWRPFTEPIAETAIPWSIFEKAGFDVQFATETGKQAACDSQMLTGTVGALLGAAKPAREAYKRLEAAPAFQTPMSWGDESFSLDSFDLVFLPGGHDKGIRQILDSPRVHALLAAYFPSTRKPARKSIAAICHGVQILSASSYEDGKSVLADAETTSLQHSQEQAIYQATRLFLCDYYKTYGPGSPSVEEIVTAKLDSPSQFKSSLTFSP